MKPSEYPVGTHIRHAFDEYVKTRQHWEPVDDKLSYITFSEMDHFHARGDDIELLAVPWDIVKHLIEDIRDYRRSYISEFDMMDVDEILKCTIDEVAEEKAKTLKRRSND